MAMRHLIAGQNNCAPDGASSSNPFGALANAVLGQSSKAQSIKELPGAAVSVPTTSDFSTAAPLSTIPGSEHEFKQDQRPLARGTNFIRGGPANDWVESFRPPGLPEFGGPKTRFAEFEQIYNNAGSTFGPALDGPPQRVLSGVLHCFLASGRAGVPFQPVPVPALGLSEGDKQCIRDRSCIMARHILADQPEEYIQAQVNTLLHSLDIDNDYRMRGPMHGPYPELEEYWNQSQSALRSAPMHDAADKWITEFGKQNNNPQDWAHSFDQQYGPNGWASEFEQHQSQMAMSQMGGANMANLAAMEQSRMLAQTLASINDPKFQLSQGADKWVSEFSTEHNQDGFNEKWIDEFSKLRVDDEWAEEFSGVSLGESSGDPWVDEFHDHLSASKQNSGASRGVYVFSEMNPYVGHPNPVQEGQELFRKGLLSEAVLALEAEVLKNPDNVEGWRLLGITHTENDDDQQAIAAMMRAEEADPTNLEVLLTLGVSHTNELEQGEALRYLYRWLQNHPKYGGLAPPQPTDSPYGPDVVRLFNDAAQMSPEDADVHIVLGVLYNLSREYDKAIASFKTALQLKPRDYSLWNKLGATQANSVQSADAILAYQQALDLKPNYVRAWANMGISYANQGLYEDSIRYYVRAVAMNPKADNAWQYLRISLSNASRTDMITACDSRNLDVLQKEFPLRTRVRCVKVVDDSPRHEASTSDTYPTQPDSPCHRVVDLLWEVHELAASVLEERLCMTTHDILEVIEQIVEKARQGIQILSCRTPRDPIDPPVRGWGGASRPRPPHPDVASGSSWHCAGSTPAQFAGPEYHSYTGQVYVEPSSSFVQPGRTPFWDEPDVSHEESRFGDFYFDQRGSQVSVGASELHGAPRPSQPTQDPLTTPSQATRAGRVPRSPEPLTYSHQRPQPPRM